MSDDAEVWTPGASGAKRDPGLDAVRAKYGSRMVSRFQAWPKLAEVYATAAECDQPTIDEEVRQAERNLKRAKADRDYALQQAEMIARALESDAWDCVPSVRQLREEWWPHQRPEQAALAAG